MSKILILVGSPRKNGNSAALAKAFADGAAANNEVRTIFAAKQDIYPCIGCNACFRDPDNRCFRRDGMDEIYDALIWADTVVIASPVYFFGISAQLKAVIDRLHNPLRKKSGAKRTALLLAAADDTLSVFDSILTQYKAITDYLKLESIGTVLAPGVYEPGDIAGHDALRQAFALGASLR